MHILIYEYVLEIILLCAGCLPSESVECHTQDILFFEAGAYHFADESIF